MRNELRVLRELREFTWLASTHVVSSGGLREPLQESDHEKDLPLGNIREGIPLLWRGTSIIWEWGSIRGDWPWEVCAVGLGDVTDKGKHSNTSMLDLRVTQECDGSLVGVTPDSGAGKLKRVVELALSLGRIGSVSYLAKEPRTGRGTSALLDYCILTFKTGFDFSARALRSSMAALVAVAARPVWDGAKAAAEPIRRERAATFMVYREFDSILFKVGGSRVWQQAACVAVVLLAQLKIER